MSNSFKSVEKKYFAFSRTIRFVITVLYPIMFLIAPIEYKFLLPFIWLLLFLGGEWLQEIYLHRIIVVPLGSITDTAQKLANLDFMTVCDIQSNDELGSLSNSLNTLASNLQNALDELNKANKQLEKDVQHERILLEQRKELVDSLSHEMKTPLGLIQAYTEGLKNEIDNDKRRKYMDAILAATERMNHQDKQPGNAVFCQQKDTCLQVGGLGGAQGAHHFKIFFGVLFHHLHGVIHRDDAYQAVFMVHHRKGQKPICLKQMCGRLPAIQRANGDDTAIHQFVHMRTVRRKQKVF